MLVHTVRTRRSSDDFPRSEHLAAKIAEVAADPVAVVPETAEMLANRIIDDAAVSAAAVLYRPVTVARQQALAHPAPQGAGVFGVGGSYSAEWAAWANGVAVREPDFHDTFLAAEYSHPGDNIPPLVAVGQQLGVRGADLIRGLATAYEIQIDLARGICLHEHKIDHVAHLGPSVAAGIGTMLRLDTETIYEAVGQALHLTTSTRQSRKGMISSWKAFAPAHAGKTAIEAVDLAMRGERSPAPIWEGEDGVIARLLSGPEREYHVPLPGPGEPKRAILDSYTKEHAAEYQSQAPIDLARRLRQRIGDPDQIAARRYHSTDPAEKAFGARAEVTLKSGEVVSDELAVADAHPLGARPFRRPQYVQKFTELADTVIEPAEQRRFLSAVESLADLESLDGLNVAVDPRVLDGAPAIPPGIFR